MDSKFDVTFEKISEKTKDFLHKIYNSFSNVEIQFKDKNKLNIAVIAIICAIIFVGMYFLNINTPLAADDFPYRYIFTEQQEDSKYVIDGDFFFIGEKVSSVKDIFESMRVHYSTMNGRVVIHSLVQLMLYLGKPVFNIANSFVYVAVMLLIYRHCVGKRKKNSAVLFGLICLSAWTFLPNWGMTSVWLCGSVNYLWGSCIRLIALLPFRLYADDGTENHSALKIPFVFVLSFLAGATNENSSAAFIGMVALFMIYYRIKNFKLHLWSIFGFIGSLGGFAFMCLAGGNSKRIVEGNETGNNLISRIIGIPGRMVMNFSVFIAVFIIISLVLYFTSKKETKVTYMVGLIYLIGAFGGAVVMLASPLFPDRAWFGLIVMCIVSVGNLAYQTRKSPALVRQIMVIGLVFWSMWGMMSYIVTAKDARNVMAQYNSRVEYIEQQKAAGNLDVVVDSIETENEHSPLYKLTDLGQKENGWQRVTKAKYYEINSLNRKN